MTNTCTNCENLNNKTDTCIKYKCVLPRNPYNEILKCDYCKEKETNNEGKNKT